MIARNERTQIRKRLVKQHQKSVVHQQMRAQFVLNGVLWAIVKGKAREVAEESGEEFDPSVECVLSVPLEGVKSLPDGFALRVVHNEDTIDIIAGMVKPKSNIILPDGSPADG